MRGYKALIVELELYAWYNIYMKYETSTNVVYSCKYHIVWCPKYRRKVLADGIDLRLKEILLVESQKVRAEILEMEVMPDHVHLLIEVPPAVGVNRAVRHLKGASSRILRQEFPALKSRLPCLWTNSYFVSTVGGAPISAVKKYIEDQKKV